MVVRVRDSVQGKLFASRLQLELRNATDTRYRTYIPLGTLRHFWANPRDHWLNTGDVFLRSCSICSKIVPADSFRFESSC